MEDILQWVNKYSGIFTAILTALNTLLIAILGIIFTRSQERLKSHLNVKFHAHTVRFEKEFKVLTDLWAAAIKLRDVVMQLNPTIIPSRLDAAAEPEEELTRKRLISCRQAFNHFFGVIDDNRPFFPQEVRQALEEIIRPAHDEAGFAERKWSSPSKISDYWAEDEASGKRREAISKQIDVIEEAIRKRMATLNEWPGHGL
jgi:hypothetical protein